MKRAETPHTPKRSLVSGAADKSKVWNVNTEEEYHETAR